MSKRVVLRSRVARGTGNHLGGKGRETSRASKLLQKHPGPFGVYRYATEFQPRCRYRRRRDGFLHQIVCRLVLVRLETFSAQPFGTGL